MGIVTVVVSGKGGVGKSTASAGLGCALAALGNSVLVIDGDAGLRNLDLIMGVASETVYDLADVFAGRCVPASAIYPSPLYAGVSVIPAPGKLEDLCSPADMRRLCRGFTRYYDQIIVDCAAGVGRGFDAATAGADRAVLVTTPDMVCARDASVVGDLLAERNVPTRLLINRLRATPILRGQSPDIDDIIDATGVQLIGVLPEDERVAVAVANGHPLPADGSTVQGFRRIARRLAGERVPLPNLIRIAP